VALPTSPSPLLIAAPCAQPTDSTTPQILARLRAIKVEVLSRPSEADDLHVGHDGSVKLFTQKRPGAPPRMPSFSAIRDRGEKKANDAPSEDFDDEELIDVLWNGC